MKVLVACEESQAVTIELRKRGHEAYSCDILPCSGGHPEWHFCKDVDFILNPKKNQYSKNQKGDFIQLPERWDLVIAFPPCTDLAVSGAAWFKKKRENGNQEKAIHFFMQFLNVDCDKIAVENPVGIISGKYIKKHFPDLCEKYNLPIKPTQIIEPYYFGDKANKKTCLWIKGLKPLFHDPKDYSSGSEYIEAPSGRKYPDWCWNTGGGSGKVRSKTFPGIAKAMAEQWTSNNNVARSISDIEIGEKYKHLPSGKVFVFESENDLAWEVLNPDNYIILNDN